MSSEVQSVLFLVLGTAGMGWHYWRWRGLTTEKQSVKAVRSKLRLAFWFGVAMVAVALVAIPMIWPIYVGITASIIGHVIATVRDAVVSEESDVQ